MMKYIDTFVFVIIKCLALSTLVSALLYKFEAISIAAISEQVVYLQILLIIAFRKFKPLSFFFIFILPYTFVAHWHFVNPDFPLSLGKNLDFDDDVYYSGVFIILGVFWSVLSLALPRLKKSIVLKDWFTFDNKPVLFYSILILQIFIMIFGRSGSSIFESGGYSSTGSNTTNLGGTSIFEYFLVLYPVAYYFSGQNKKKLFLLLGIGGLYCLKAVLFGGRIEMLQCLILIYLLHFDNARTSLFKIVLFASPAIVFFVAFGFYRTSPDLSLLELYTLILENLNYSIHGVFGNQVDVYYSSSRLYGFCIDGILSVSERWSIFLYNMVAVVVPYSWLPDKANLAAYKQDIYYAGGGGFLPVYFYVYLSYFGVVLIAGLIGGLFRRLVMFPNRISIYLIVYGTMILSTFPRWYAYSANVIYKFCVYSIIVLFFMRQVSKLLYKKSSTFIDNSNL